MPHRPDREETRLRAASFLACEGLSDLARRWHVDAVRLAVMAEDPEYKRFLMPKKRKGEFRQIEDPDPKLKRVLRKLNRDLQAVYYTLRSPAAYGFVINPTDEPDKRDILSNAERHLGARWLMNVDMRDFFHQIDTREVRGIFLAYPFSFPKRTARVLAGLTTYLGRLPMGAPTSPVLSNFYARELDAHLTAYAKNRGWVYTRYADDLTFSSRSAPIRFTDIKAVGQRIERFDLCLNPSKSVIYGPDYPNKEVTGLIVGGEQVTISPEFLAKTREGIRRLNEVVDTKYLMPSGRVRPTPWVEEVARSVKGLVRFAHRVLPDDDPLALELQQAYEDALAPPQDYGPVSWLEFGYLNFRIDANPDA